MQFIPNAIQIEVHFPSGYSARMLEYRNMSIASFFRWYPTRTRLQREIDRLETLHGNRAFLVAIQRYWFAKSDRDRCRAGFWKAVSAEIIRRERRRTIIAAALGEARDLATHRPSVVPSGLCERTFG